MAPPTKTGQAAVSRGRYKKTQDLADAILETLETYSTLSMSTRQIFYQVVSSGAVENKPAGYDKVQRLVVQLRRSGDIDYSRVVDRTRTKHHAEGWKSAEQVVRTFGKHFRRDMWAEQDTIVMIGLEKQALEGIFAEVVDEYGSSLWTLHGYGSESFLYEWAEEIKEFTDKGKNVVVYYFGDHDPTGLDIERAAQHALYGHGGCFSWMRSGLLHSDFNRFDLVNVPVKNGDSRAKNYLKEFGDRAAELDALPPDELQRRIRQCIDQHVDHEARARLLRNEAIERETINLIAGNWELVKTTVGGVR